MAIIKTAFVGETRAEQFAEVYAWIEENAADLFADISGDSQSGYIWCNKRQDVPMGALTLCPNNGSYIAYLFIPATNSSGYQVVSMGANNQSIVFEFGVKTSKGIYIQWSIGDIPCGIFVSKAINGDTFAVYCYYNSSTSDGHFGCANLISGEGSSSSAQMIADGLSSYYIYGNLTSMQAQYTALNPFVSPYAETYCPHIYQLHFNQFVGQSGKLTMNGNSYYANGYFALAD